MLEPWRRRRRGHSHKDGGRDRCRPYGGRQPRHERSFRFVLGSVPNKISHHCPCNLLIVDTRARARTLSEQPRVVVVGAGFAGLAACERLAKAQVDVVVVDRHNYNTFQPLLYQVATAGLNPGDIAYPIRAYTGLHENVRFREDEVVAVDFAVRSVSFVEGPPLLRLSRACRRSRHCLLRCYRGRGECQSDLHDGGRRCRA